MARFNSPLDRVRIAAPCKADWEEMVGTDRVRFCGQCNLNVYNLSSMTKPEAESFISRNEGRLCIRFYRRGDGSILTRNCPVGLRAIRRRMTYLARAVTSTALGFFAGLGLFEGFYGSARLEEGITGAMLRVEPPLEEGTTGTITRVADEASPPQVFEVKGQVVVPMSMGRVVFDRGGRQRGHARRTGKVEATRYSQ
jgi:hypothetical protein